MSGRFLIPLTDLGDHHRPRVGGKATALARLAGLGFNIAPGLVITTDCYDRYMKNSGLHEKIVFEMGRKSFKDLRWEEIWDIALRIDSHFLKTPVPEPLKQEFLLVWASLWSDRAMLYCRE